MDLGLGGKVALVAASSKGLGRAVARELAVEGASLVMCARGEAALESARRERERKKAEQAAKDGSSTGRDEERAARRAAREMEAVEAEIARLEGRVAELGGVLEDPSLYESADGTRRAVELGAELETAKRELTLALERWEELGVRAG